MCIGRRMASISVCTNMHVCIVRLCVSVYVDVIYEERLCNLLLPPFITVYCIPWLILQSLGTNSTGHCVGILAKMSIFASYRLWFWDAGVGFCISFPQVQIHLWKWKKSQPVEWTILAFLKERKSWTVFNSSNSITELDLAASTIACPPPPNLCTVMWRGVRSQCPLIPTVQVKTIQLTQLNSEM